MKDLIYSLTVHSLMFEKYLNCLFKIRSGEKMRQYYSIQN
jgi:hypothetical protein